MGNGRVRIDAGIAGVGISVVTGAAIALAPHPWLWGLLGLGVAMTLWGLAPAILHSMKGEHSTSDEPRDNLDNRGGAFVGGDNSGTINVHHSDVTIHQGQVAPVQKIDFPDGHALVQRLTGFFKGHTELQGQKLVAPFLGKTAKMGATVRGVRPLLTNEKTMVFADLPRKLRLSEGLTVAFVFDKEHAGAMHLLKKGDKITVIGAIDGVDENKFLLEKCALIHGSPEDQN